MTSACVCEQNCSIENCSLACSLFGCIYSPITNVLTWAGVGRVVDDSLGVRVRVRLVRLAAVGQRHGGGVVQAGGEGGQGGPGQA